MCGGGGGLGDVFGDVADVVTGIFAPEFLPLVAGAGTFLNSELSGQGFGKSLTKGLFGGAEALGGQELAGAFGLGQGNTAFNSALGITGDNPAGTGLPDLGKGVSSLFSSTGLSSGAIPDSPIPGGAPGTIGAMPGTVGTSPSGGGAVGGGGASAGAISAPSGVGGAGPDLTQAADAATSVGNNAALNAGDSAASFATGAGGGVNGGNSQLDSLLKSFQNQQAPTDALSPNVISASNSASPGGTDVSLNQPGTIASLTGSQTPVAQGTAAGASVSPTGNSGVNLLKSFASGNNIGGSFEDFLSKNANLAIPAGVLGYDAITSGKTPPGYDQLKNQADQLSSQGQQLEGYLQSGNLPPGLQGAVQQNLAAEQAAIKSRYASMGGSGSSAEQQDLANAAQRSQGQSAQLALNLLQTGISETGQSAGIYQNLMKDIESSDAGLTSALAAFASAAAGGGQGGQKFTISAGA